MDLPACRRQACPVEYKQTDRWR